MHGYYARQVNDLCFIVVYFGYTEKLKIITYETEALLKALS